MMDGRTEGLWRNCADSISHALGHFAGAAEEGGFHHKKWAILSVAHAAEVFCNLLLCTFDPGHALDGWYPPLGKATKALLGDARLTASERRVLAEVLAPLDGQRNTLMHEPAPEVLNVSEAAVALLALLHVIRLRSGHQSTYFFDQRPPLELDVFESVSLNDHEKWFALAERLAWDEYGAALRVCECCGVLSVPPASACLACFVEIDRGD